MKYTICSDCRPFREARGCINKNAVPTFFAWHRIFIYSTSIFTLLVRFLVTFLQSNTGTPTFATIS